MKKIFGFIILTFYFSNSFAQLSPVHDSIPMRDGKKLAADIYTPSGTSQQRPTILIQTPYNKNLYQFGGLPAQIGMNINNSPYNFVIVDWRCFYGSTNACTTLVKRGEDGYDCVEWIAQQTWSDGHVGTLGASALGIIQFQTAKEHPPHLTCAVPIVAGMKTAYIKYYPGGVYRTEYVQMLDALGYGLSTLLLAHPVHDIYWTISENNSFYPDSISVPMFMIGGWYDHATEDVLESFEGIRTQSPLTVRSQHKLLMGPWTHNKTSNAPDSVGQLSYPQAKNFSDSLARVFFDYYMLNAANGWTSRPVVEYFQMGENTWNNDTSWNVNNLTNYNLYFHKNGKLDLNIPAAVADTQKIIYDPHNPSPTVGGPTLLATLSQGPYNQSTQVESRNDILTYTTDPLTQDVVLRGKPTIHLKISSDKLDTDFSARLTDVYPDGRSMLVLDGIRRMRFRTGYNANDTSVITSGNIYSLDFDLISNTAITFLAGHSIRVDITSSNYPRFDRNLNNGQAMYVSSDTLTANNVVYLNNTNHSFITLPLESFPNGIAESGNENPVIIFPNPNNGEFTVYGLGTTDRGIISIIDLTGRKIYSEKFSTISATINCKPETGILSSGIYFLKIETKNSVIIKKFSLMR